MDLLQIPSTVVLESKMISTATGKGVTEQMWLQQAQRILSQWILGPSILIQIGVRTACTWWEVMAGAGLEMGQVIHTCIRRCGFDPWVKKIPWRRKWQSTPVLPGRIPWTEEPGRLQSVGSQKSQTRLSMYTLYDPQTHLNVCRIVWPTVQGNHNLQSFTKRVSILG